MSRSIALAIFAAVASSQCGGAKAATTQISDAISPASATAPVAVEVIIGQYKFLPESVLVSVGQVVRWKNDDNVGHTVTFTAVDTGPKRPMASRAELLALNRPKELYSSRLFAQGESWSAKFDKPGRYAYICDPHPYMRGIVVVR